VSPRAPYRETSLWFLIAGPTIWSAHFLVSYISAAIYCAKAPPPHDMDLVQWIIAGATVLALAAIGLAGWLAARKWQVGVRGWTEHKASTLEDRNRFMGHATWLLCALSAVATIYVALPAIFSATCL
jgi:hypothetical protein